MFPFLRKTDTKDLTSEGVQVEKFDGKKTQPIAQFRLTSKAAGKKTEKIKDEWRDSITTAHTMLVNVNKELASILKELDDISKELKTLRNKSGSKDIIQKFNDVKDELQLASDKADGIVKSFKDHVPPSLIRAGAALEKWC